MPVIAPDNDAVIAQMLAIPRDGPSVTWWLELWRARQTWIDARFRARGGPWAIVRLLERSQPAPASLPQRSSATFKLVVLDSSPGAPLDRLFEVLETRVRAHEGAFRWVDPRPTRAPAAQLPTPSEVPVERLVVEAGIKPALRIRVHAWEAPYEVGLWLRAGFAVAALETDAGADGARTYVIVARTDDHARALLDAELRQYLPLPAQLDALRDCGRLLGYPPCCIEAFLASTALESGADPEVEARRGNFRRLDAAWVPEPHPHLNTLRQHERIGLISFDPCTLDCEAARTIADASAAQVEARCPGYVDALRGAYAVNHDDARAALELSPGCADQPRQILAARPTREDAVSFAARLVGHFVDTTGRIPPLAEPCRVFVFA